MWKPLMLCFLQIFPSDDIGGKPFSRFLETTRILPMQ